jgi:hypothetical protein
VAARFHDASGSDTRPPDRVRGNGYALFDLWTRALVRLLRRDRRLLHIRLDDRRYRPVGRRHARLIGAQDVRERRLHGLHCRQHFSGDRREDGRRHCVKGHGDHHAPLSLIKRSEGTDRPRHRRIAAVAFVSRIDDGRRRHDSHFEVADPEFGKSKLLGGRSRDVEFASSPVGPRVVDPDDRGVAVRRIADKKNGAVGKDRARGAIGFVRAKRFAGGRQSAGVVGIAPAIIVIRGLEDLIAADDGDHFGNA